MAYDNPGGLIAMAVILEALALSSVALRFVSRRQTHAGFASDDWLVAVGLVFASALFVVQIYGSTSRAFAVPLNVTIADLEAAGRRFNVTRNLEFCLFIFGTIALAFIKLSVVLLYRRIFSGRGWFGIVSMVWIGVLALWGICFLIAVFAECGNHLMALFSTPGAYLQRCNHAIKIGWAMVITDSITDLFTLLLPVPMVMNLHCSLRRKLEIAAVFAIGFFTVGASTAKAAVYIKSSLNLYHTDAILLITQISVWNYVEVQVGIMAACAVTIRPVLSKIKASASLASFQQSLIGKGSSPRPTKCLEDSSSETSYAEATKYSPGQLESVGSKNQITLSQSYSVYREQGRAEAGQ